MGRARTGRRDYSGGRASAGAQERRGAPFPRRCPGRVEGSAEVEGLVETRTVSRGSPPDIVPVRSFPGGVTTCLADVTPECDGGHKGCKGLQSHEPDTSGQRVAKDRRRAEAG